MSTEHTDHPGPTDRSEPAEQPHHDQHHAEQVADRMATFEVSPAECWRLLRRSEVGRLAVSISDHPDIFPINFVVDGDSIVFRTAAGTKLAGAVLGRGVAFEVDGYDPIAGEAWSVVVKGRARQIEHMMEYFAADELPLFPWNASPKPDIVRIDAEIVTGRRFHVVEHAALGGAPPT